MNPALRTKDSDLGNAPAPRFFSNPCRPCRRQACAFLHAEGGIIIPDTVKEKPQEGKIIAAR